MQELSTTENEVEVILSRLLFCERLIVLRRDNCGYDTLCILVKLCLLNIFFQFQYMHV